jgi:hypothetical protein
MGYLFEQAIISFWQSVLDDPPAVPRRRLTTNSPS